MHDVVVEVYSQGKAHEVKFGELFQNQRVLICNIIRPEERVTHHYINHLAEQRAVYQSHNIEIVLLSSTPWGAACLDTFFPEFKIVLDRKQEFLNYLANNQHKTNTAHWLSRFWQYQVLINNNSIEHFTEQPTENRMADVKKHLNKEQFKYLLTADNGRGIYLLRQYFKEDESLVFERELLFWISNEWSLYNLLFFYHVWPNRSLQQYLKII